MSGFTSGARTLESASDLFIFNKDPEEINKFANYNVIQKILK